MLISTDLGGSDLNDIQSRYRLIYCSDILDVLLSPVLAGVGDVGDVDDVDDSTQDSWGGRYHRPDPGRFPQYRADLPSSAEECQATISR